MTIAQTEHDKMMFEIMEFTKIVVAVSCMKNADVHAQARAIFMAEKLFHKVVMDKIVTKCVEKSIPSNN